MGTPLSLPRYAVQGGLMIDIYDIAIKVDSLNLSIIQLSAYLPCVMNDASQKHLTTKRFTFSSSQHHTA